MRGRDEHSVYQYTSQIDMESLDDKSRVVIFVKHPKQLVLKDILQRNQVILIRNALRKVTISAPPFV